MSRVYYGIRIPTGTAINDSTWGISSGVFQWITDRPTGTYTPGPVNYSTWKQGVIAKDSLDSASNSIDIIEAGGYASLSGFGFSVKNAPTLFWKFLKDNSIELYRRTVEFYIWIDDVQSRLWTGVIDNISWSEIAYRVSCVDSYKAIHQPFPPKIIDKSAYPSANSESVGRVVPVALGRVPKAKLLGVVQAGSAIDITQISSTNYKVCASAAYNSGNRTLDLKTGDLAFVENDSRLVGKYVTLLTGNDKESRKIISCLATTGTGAANRYTRVTLDEAFTATPYVAHTAAGPQADNVWYFEVTEFSAKLFVSHNPVKKFEPGLNGAIFRLFYFDTEKKEYVDIGQVAIKQSTSDIEGEGHPGFKIIAKRVTSTGEVKLIVPIVPERITMHSRSNASAVRDGYAGSLITDGTELPQLRDRNTSTFISAYSANGVIDCSVAFRVQLPAQAQNQKYEFAGIFSDDVYTWVGGSGNLIRDTTLATQDIYGTSVVGLGTGNDTAGTHSSGLNVNGLPELYYTGEAINNPTYLVHKTKGGHNITTLFTEQVAANFFPEIIYEIKFELTSANPIIAVREIGVIAEILLNVATNTYYTDVVGETFGDTWGGRKTAANHVSTGCEAIEYIMRRYDNAASYVDGTAFQATDQNYRWNWIVGAQVEEQKNSFEYINELARHLFLGIGITRDGKRYPVAWREAIGHVAVFNENSILRGTLKELKRSEMRRVYNDIRIKYNKNRATNDYDNVLFLTNVDQPSFPAVDEAGGALTPIGTFFAVQQEIDVSSPTGYAWILRFSVDPGLAVGDYVTVTGNVNGFNFAGKQIVNGGMFTRVYAEYNAAYPLNTDSLGGTCSEIANPNPKWKTYAGGFPDSMYAAAKELWEKCHDSYLVTNTKNPLPENLSECPWFIDQTQWDVNPDSPGVKYSFGASNSAYNYLENLVDWVSRVKDLVEFSIPLNTTSLGYKLLDAVYFADAKLTNSVNRLGWITRLEVDPKGDKIDLELTLSPDGVTMIGITSINENGAETESYNENGATTESVNENGA